MPTHCIYVCVYVRVYVPEGTSSIERRELLMRRVCRVWFRYGRRDWRNFTADLDVSIFHATDDAAVAPGKRSLRLVLTGTTNEPRLSVKECNANQ